MTDVLRTRIDILVKVVLRAVLRITTPIWKISKI